MMGVRPDRGLVVGDENSTLAAALTAVKLRMPVAHVDAGLRNHDRTMPEEINRVLTDAISTDLFVTEQTGVENLRREGRRAEHVYLVGNVMIDALLAFRSIWEERARIIGPPASVSNPASPTLSSRCTIPRTQMISRPLPSFSTACKTWFPTYQ